MDSHLSCLPNTGMVIDVAGGDDATTLTLSALTLVLASLAVGIRLRGQRT